jgi:hypothetical protein
MKMSMTETVDIQVVPLARLEERAGVRAPYDCRASAY